MVGCKKRKTAKRRPRATTVRYQAGCKGAGWKKGKRGYCVRRKKRSAAYKRAYARNRVTDPNCKKGNRWAQFVCNYKKLHPAMGRGQFVPAARQAYYSQYPSAPGAALFMKSNGQVVAVQNNLIPTEKIIEIFPTRSM